MEDIFAEATRQKIRFETAQGCLTAEDLWDLPLTGHKRVHLDGIAVEIYQDLQTQQQVSFVNDPPKANTLLQLKFDVVKQIINVKKAEKLAAEQAAEQAARKNKLLEILARKQDTALEGLSVDELQAMVATL